MTDNVSRDDVPLREFLRWIDSDPRPMLFDSQSNPNGPFNALKLLHHRIAVGAQRDESVSDQDVERLTDAAESLIIEIAASTADTNAHAFLDEYTNKLIAVATAKRRNRCKAIVDLDSLNKRLDMLWASLLQTAQVLPVATPVATPETPNSAPEGKLDGPDGGCWVRWKGTKHDVPKGNVYKMIAYFWNRESASYEDLYGNVFDGTVEPQTIRSKLSATSAVLKKIGIPWKLSANSTSRMITKKTRL